MGHALPFASPAGPRPILGFASGRGTGLLAGLLLWATAASGHTTSTGLATVQVEDERLQYTLTLPLADLPESAARPIRAALAGDGAAATEVAAMLRSRVRFAVAGQACTPGRVRLQALGSGEDRARLELLATCARAPGRLELTDELSQPFGEHYRAIASILGPDGYRQELLFSAEQPAGTVDLGHSTAQGWWSFLRMGMEHIWTGYDHLLFLMALLMGSTGVWPVLAIVTAFTVAHSITVSLAGFGLVTLPGSIIEPAIAASIVFVSLENIFYASSLSRRWLIAFGFGLVHGFGFAAALTEVELSGWPFARALLGFNLGVEIGQAAVVIVAAPALLWLLRRPNAQRYATACSIAVALIGTGWFIQRVFLT